MTLHVVIGLSCEMAFMVICGGEVVHPWILPICEGEQPPYYDGEIVGSIVFECDVTTPVEIIPVEDMTSVELDPNLTGDIAELTINPGDPVFDGTGRQVSTYAESNDLPSGVYYVGFGRKIVIVR